MATPEEGYGQDDPGNILPRRQLDPYHISEDGPAQGTLTSSIGFAGPSAMGKKGSDPSTSNTNNLRHYSYSRSDTSATLGSSQTALEHGAVRTLPMWITSYEQGSHFDPVQVQTSSQSLASPTKTHTAQHHYANAKPERRVSQDGYISEEETDAALARSAERGIFGGAKVPERGRKWDHARVDEPTIIHSGVTGERMSWITKLVRSSMYGPMENEDRHQVDYEFLNSLTPGYQKPWRGDAEKDIELGLLHSKKRRKLWYQRVQQILLMHPLVPLGFRLIVLATSVIALGLSATIYSLDNGSKFSQAPSTIMAIIVDVIAMPYICYITWDEYTGKPLGLRSPRAKMRLVLLDLFFIIFESANAAIAFAAISDPHGACVAGDSGTNGFTCRRVKALAGFLLVALIAWSMTFTVSIFRLVERVGGREEDEN